MKLKSILLVAILLLNLGVTFAQAPEKMNYQAVARDLSGLPLVSTAVNLQFDILQGSSSGTVAYSETQSKTTNQFGLFTAEIGSGTVVSGSFSGMAWGTSAYFLRITVNGDVMPATQLLSVPYALYSKTSGGGGSALVAGSGIDITGGVITATSDTSATNEFQTLSLSAANDTVFLSNGGFIVLPPSVGDDWGADTVNTSGLNILGSGTVANPLIVVDNDTSLTNELQNLSWNTTDSNIINLSAGTGIQLSSNTPLTNQVLTWNGANWIAQAVGGGPWTKTGTNIYQTTLTDYVGIGTATPGYPLEVATGNGLWDNAVSILPSSNAGSSRAAITLDDWGILQDIDGNNLRNFGIYQNSTSSQRFVIGVNGNVGIGTTAPSQKLDIVGTAEIDSLRINNSYAFPTAGGILNQVLAADAAGNAIWQTPLSAAFATTSNVTSNSPGDYTTDDFVFGSPQLDGNGVTGNHSRMFFDKSKSAFRAGSSINTSWNDANVGAYSVAFGNSITASGTGSHASGNNSIASGDYSFLHGSNLTASGLFSFVQGSASQATATGAVAFGNGSIGNGIYSLTTGTQNTSESYTQVTVGSFATIQTGSQFSLVGTDRAFVIGNGTALAARSDAFTILKNGSAFLNGTLTIDADNVSGAGNSYTLPGQDGTANQVLTTNGTGVTSWQTPSAASLWSVTGSAVHPTTLTNNVGIGTNSPSASGNLTVESQASKFIVLDLPGGGGTVVAGSWTSTTLNPQLRFKGVSAGTIDIGQDAAGNFVVEGSDTPRLTVMNTGNVGVGIATPSARFHSTGTLRLENLGGTAPAVGSVLTAIDANGNAQWQAPSAASLWTQGTGLIYNTTLANNVGIGTNTPSTKLDVLGGVNILHTAGNPLVIRSATDGFGFIVRESDNGNDAINIFGYASRGRIVINENGTANINFDANSSLPSYINAGNFGIGLIAPAHKLDVLGGINTSTAYHIDGITFLDNKSTSTLVGATGNTALTGVDNTIVGRNAGASSTTGSENVFLGNSSGNANTTGGQNVAIGAGSSALNQLGWTNVAIGYNTLNQNVTSGNTAIGFRAMEDNTTGVQNAALGLLALNSNVTGNSNTAIGNGALEVTLGNNNTGLGYNAGNINISGTNNTFIGHNANAAAGQTNLTNATAIGSNATVSASNSLILGNNANVGIGTTSPAEKLDVVGNAQVTGDYNYASTKTRTLSIPISALNQKKNETSSPASYLVHESYVAGYYGESGYCYFKNGSIGTEAVATAPVYLPQGAVVTELKVKWFDQSVAYNASLSLELVNFGTINNVQMATVSTTGSATSTLGMITSTDATINSATINNDSNVYYVKMSSQENTTLLGFAKIVITYTVTQAD